MDKNDRGDATPERQRQDTDEISAEEAASSAAPGSGVLNSSRSGHAVSENPVIRADRDSGDILAEQVREGRRTSGREDEREG